jgi:hypothetical protein
MKIDEESGCASDQCFIGVSSVACTILSFAAFHRLAPTRSAPHFSVILCLSVEAQGEDRFDGRHVSFVVWLKVETIL